MSGGVAHPRIGGSDTALVPRVVVIDDDVGLRATVRITLRAQGWDVLEAGDPDAGVDLVQRSRPDIVLLDVSFPGEFRDGFAVCRELRMLPATKNVPIVLFTASDDAESRAFASAVGATAFLAKPFGAVELERFLRLVRGTAGAQPALGLYLIDAGIATPQQLDRALAEQRLRQGPKVPLGQILVELGYALQGDIDAALLKQARARASRGARGVAAGDRRVVIADDHAGVRDGLREAISSVDGLTVVGIAADGAEALRLARTLQPDVMVLDNDMPKRSGMDVLPSLRAEVPQTGIVMFTLDETIRERALALGAAAVVTKDESLDSLIAVVRKASGGSRPATVGEPGVVLAARGVVRRAGRVWNRQKRIITALGIIAVAYTGAFLIAETVMGASAAALGVIAVMFAGAFLGLEGGLAAGVVVTALTAVLWATTGHQVGEPVATIGGNGIGVLVLLGIGAGFGVMRAVRGRLNNEARQAGAIAEAAILFASAAGPQVLRLVARGALETVPGECALLFLPVPGGGLELVAAVGTPLTVVGSRRVGQAIARARDRGLPLITDAGGASIGVEVRGMRTALVAPLPETRDGVGGVIVTLSHHRDVYRSEHATTLAAYGAFVDGALHAHVRTAAMPAVVTERARV